MKKILILGGGTAGTMMSAKLARALELDEWEITVVDQDNTHIYQPGLLFIPFGVYECPSGKCPEFIWKGKPDMDQVLCPTCGLDLTPQAIDSACLLDQAARRGYEEQQHGKD